MGISCTNILQTFPMDADMDNIATKKTSLYDGSVNGLSDQQKLNMNHIYLHPDLIWLYSQE